MTIGNPNNFIIYAAMMACCFGMAADLAANGQLTWRWLMLASFFLAGFWYSYTGGKLK
jgi:hypothetical protein